MSDKSNTVFTLSGDVSGPDNTTYFATTPDSAIAGHGKGLVRVLVALKQKPLNLKH